MNTIENISIYLRLINKSDINQNYLSWFKDKKVTEFLDASNLTKENVIKYINSGLKNKSYYIYAICDKKNDQHIGNIKVGPIDHEHKVSDLVTFIGDTDYWGKGIATQAIELGNKFAFNDYDIRKLSGAINSNNIGSLKCYTKAGWLIEGVLYGHNLYSGKPSDKVIVSCFNPKYFDLNKIKSISLDKIIK